VFVIVVLLLPRRPLLAQLGMAIVINSARSVQPPDAIAIVLLSDVDVVDVDVDVVDVFYFAVIIVPTISANRIVVMAVIDDDQRRGWA
jgi:hypothetical protein